MKKLLFTLTLLAAITSFAQSYEPKPEIPYIEVNGTAEKEVVPDIIYVSIALTDKVVNKDTYTISAQEEKLKKALQGLGIDLKNLTLADASSDVIMHKRREKGVAQRQEYLLKLSTASEVTRVFEMLHDNDIKEATISRVDHSKMDELRKEVRINAIKAAKDKATYLLEAIGQQPGKPLIVREEMGMPYRANMYSNVSFDAAAMGRQEETDFRKIKIQFSYYVKYEIK